MKSFKISRPGRRSYGNGKIFVAYTLFLSVFLMRSFQTVSSSSAYESVAPDTLQKIELPDPVFSSEVSVEEAIYKRRSIRNFSKDSLSVNEISQLLWAAQGVTSSSGKRTAPSAGALYPLEIYLVSDAVKNVPQGLYHYLPDDHAIEKKISGELSSDLYRAALFQPSIKKAAGTIIITAEFHRTLKKYGIRGERYIFMEAGHAAQNICLQSVSLGIGTVTIGSFKDSVVAEILNLAPDEYPLYLLPIGKISTTQP